MQMAMECKAESEIKRFAIDDDPSGISEMLLSVFDGAECSEDSYIVHLMAKMLEAHDVNSKIIQGEGYLSGEVLVSSPEKACGLFEEAANTGSARGMYDLGDYFYSKQEYARAIECFEECLKTKSLDDSRLGLCYGKLGDSYSHLPVPQYNKAIDRLSIAVTKYHILYAATRLGEIYMEQSSPDERKKGITYLKMAAKNGDADAASALAELYIFGDKELGISPDRLKAEELLSPYEGSDHMHAQYLLAQMSLFGVVGEDSGGSQGAERAVPLLEGLWSASRSATVADTLGFAYYLLGREEDALDLWEYADREGKCSYLDFLGRIYVQECKNSSRGLSCYDRAYRSEGGLANAFVYSEYVKLLIDAGRFDDAFSVAAEGEQRYNDIVFVFHEALLVLEGKRQTADPYRYVRMMQDCTGYKDYELRARRVLADYFMSINSPSEAKVQLKELYDLGEHDVAYRLGMIYGYEPLLAIDWFVKAFDNGNSEAALRVAEIYEKRLSDTDSAYEWYAKAAAAGSEEGIAESGKFKRTMFGHYKRA